MQDTKSWDSGLSLEIGVFSTSATASKVSFRLSGLMGLCSSDACDIVSPKAEFWGVVAAAGVGGTSSSGSIRCFFWSGLFNCGEVVTAVMARLAGLGTGRF